MKNLCTAPHRHVAVIYNVSVVVRWYNKELGNSKCVRNLPVRLQRYVLNVENLDVDNHIGIEMTSSISIGKNGLHPTTL